MKYYGRDYSLRDDLSNKIWIKTEFAVCLSQAETWMWYEKKSKNNYFNCGNNDRGDTVSYAWLKQSFRDLWYSCLNWTYLWQKQTLSHLSPYHKRSSCYQNNEDPLCKYAYATSKESRLNNMQNCLSNIHQKQIEVDYEFRK